VSSFTPEIEDILNKIEELRDKPHKFAEGKILTDPEVVSMSQMLDVLLNEYCRLMKDKIERLKQ
jgi:hypothetical protein